MYHTVIYKKLCLLQIEYLGCTFYDKDKAAMYLETKLYVKLDYMC